MADCDARPELRRGVHDFSHDRVPAAKLLPVFTTVLLRAIQRPLVRPRPRTGCPLGLPYSEDRLSGMGPDVEGKYNVWYENVSFTVREAKELTNAVVSAGGEVYEAFLR